METCGHRQIQAALALYKDNIWQENAILPSPSARVT